MRVYLLFFLILNGCLFTSSVNDTSSAGSGSLVSTPSVSSTTIPSSGQYTPSDNLDFKVTFDENITVTGTPRIVITIGNSTVYADFTSLSTSTTMDFRYTVGSSVIDLDGISVGSIELSSGTIRNSGGGNASLSLGTIDSSGVLVTPVAFEIWLDSQDSATLWKTSDCSTTAATSNGDAVKCWKDKSTNSNNALRVAGNAPLKQGSGLSFDDSQGNYYLLNAFSSPEMIFVLSNVGPVPTNSNNKVNSLLGTETGASPTSYIFLSVGLGYLISLDGSTSDTGFYSLNGAAQVGPGTNIGSSDYPQDSTKRILSIDLNSGPAFNWKSLGRINSGTIFNSTMTMHEILFFTSNITNTQQQIFEGYLACKWSLQSGLDAGHPYKSSCP